MSGLRLRARIRRCTAGVAVVAVVAGSGLVPLAAAASMADVVGAEPPAVDIPLFGPTTPKAKKAKKTKRQATTPGPSEPSAEPSEPSAEPPKPADGEAAPVDAESPKPEAGEAAPVDVGSPGSVDAEVPTDAGAEAEAEEGTPGAEGSEPAAAAPSGEPASASAGAPEDPADAAEDEGAGAAEAEAAADRAAGSTEEEAAAGEPEEAAKAEPTPPVNDGPVTVTTKIGPDPSFVGDLLTLEIIAAYPKGYRVNLPTGVDFSPLHLVSIEEGEPEPSAEGYFRKVFTVTLQHFDVGESKVPGFPLTYVGGSGEVETVRVAPRPFTVDSLLANEADPERKLEDPPISLEYPNTTAELVIYSAAVAMLAGFFLALFWRRFASRRQVVVGPPPVPAHELALSALEELEKSEFLETGMVQDYYLELTEIAKGYLEGRFGVDALDRTTDEIRRDLIRHRERIKPLEPDDVLRFLEDCDLVKFARFDPELDEARSALYEVRTMVQETVPTVSSGMTSIGAAPGDDAVATSAGEKAASVDGSGSADANAAKGGEAPEGSDASSRDLKAANTDTNTDTNTDAKGSDELASAEGSPASDAERATSSSSSSSSSAAERLASAQASAKAQATSQGEEQA